MKSHVRIAAGGGLALLLASCGAMRDPPATANGAPDANGYPAADAGYSRSSDAGADLAPPSGAGDAPAGADYGAADYPAAAPAPRYTPLVPAAGDPGRAPPPREQRYDNVGYAGWSREAGGGVSAAHATLPPGSFAEVTALDTGRTILVPITAVVRSGREIELSGAAAQELGLGAGDDAPVRVRAANASGADQYALQAGRPAPARPDTPPVLLTALRSKLGATRRTPALPERYTAPPARTATAPRPARPPARTAVPSPAPAGSAYRVQVAALSDASRAQALARALGGSVQAGGGLYRVQLGPFADARAAQAARDGVARRGYGDARIVRD